MRAREEARKNSKERRQFEKTEQIKLSVERKRKLMGTFAKIVTIVSQPSFVLLVNEAGIKSIPQFLMKHSDQNRHFHAPSNDNQIANTILDFAIAWKFLFPLLSNEAIANYLDLNFPGFISEIKDAFIAAVMHGPYFDEPDMMSSGKRLKIK